MMPAICYTLVAVALLWPSASSDNSTSDSCGLEPWGSGPWSALLEEWATAPALSERQGRIMLLPPASGYYVTNRVDVPPPPPPQHGPLIPHSVPMSHGTPPPAGPFPYEEWYESPPPPSSSGKGSKIVNRPNQSNKDRFKPSPSYPLPPQNHQYPSQSHPHYSAGPSAQYHQTGSPSNPHRGPGPMGSAVDRIDDPPRKTVSETDLYLLSAIEKLVYRVDLMEKRLRKLEESVHYFVAGHDKKPDPCVTNFTRVGEACYHFSAEAADWKAANLACRKLRANLLELDSAAERRAVAAAMLADKRIRGTDVWTGGLNPGLLWIWSHSARPVAGNGTAGGNETVTVVGEGRCLAFVHDPTLNTYVYRGQECALRHRFVCEAAEAPARLSNEVARVARAARLRRGLAEGERGGE
ncbi:uncharacterized protein LOC113240180 isoform X2 [Hyposmocoma kahamanoa]|uniref:uncharacterized protein LOC113240180 isoform X2 n=1 Tax=Hyposmocoma kahamanoa TaxID=1477025 RepID=UPI000E6D8C5E|nr:uncharacterized protein LOC113240180 isoform X2 [Hyposmocoma kahamanoa]